VNETSDEAAYHLHLEQDEVAPAASALRLLISDEAHEPDIRSIARGVLAALDGQPNGDGVLIVALDPPGLKITHTAVKLLFDDLGREQADERRILGRIIEKLPDEHAIRAIVLD
jgi:hypothetical protein